MLQDEVAVVYGVRLQLKPQLCPNLLWIRRSALLQKVQQSTRQAQEEGTGAPSARAYKRRHGGSSGDSSLQGARDANVELINVMLEALEKEHECLYQSLLQPIIAFVSLVAPDASRDAAAKGELAFEDLDKMAPEHAAAIVEWLTEKVDSLSSKLKADPKDEEEVGQSRVGWDPVGV